jgi:hypothetical protein
MTDPFITDAEIAGAAERLGLNRDLTAPPRRKAGVGYVQQNLPHGRSHVVTVEVKQAGRRAGARRPGWQPG